MLYLSDVMNNPFLMGKLLFKEDENVNLPIHWHYNVEIGYFIQGGFDAQIDSQMFRMKNDQLVVINSGQMHYLGADSVGDDKGIILVADMDYWKGICPDLDMIEFDFSLSNEKYEETKNLMRKLYHASQKYYREKTTGANNAVSNRELLNINSLICRIYYNMVTCFAKAKRPVVGTHPAMRTNVQDVVQYINEHYKEHLSLKEAASFYGISTEHLARLFKKDLGLTFKEYLTRVRLMHACKMLTYTDESLMNVAMDAGFPDAKSFTLQFRRVYDMVPREYRRKYSRIGTEFTEEKHS